MGRTARIAAFLAGLGLAIFCATASATSTSNLEREKNWADQVVDYLVAGEAVWLEAEQVKFLGLYTEPAGDGPAATWGVILLHGRGVHPAWGFIDTLRIDLAQDGWSTLSLQLPVLTMDARLGDYAATFPEAFQRIDAGVRYLKQRGVTQIVLVGHSTGAIAALAYGAEHPNPTLAGIAVIGITHDPHHRTMMPPTMLQKIRLPVLDIFGSADLPEVTSQAAARAGAARQAGNRRYRQVRVSDANHFYTNRYETLKARLSDWLKTLIPGR